MIITLYFKNGNVKSFRDVNYFVTVKEDGDNY